MPTLTDSVFAAFYAEVSMAAELTWYCPTCRDTIGEIYGASYVQHWGNGCWCCDGTLSVVIL